MYTAQIYVGLVLAASLLSSMCLSFPFFLLSLPLPSSSPCSPPILPLPLPSFLSSSPSSSHSLSPLFPFLLSTSHRCTWWHSLLVDFVSLPFTASRCLICTKHRNIELVFFSVPLKSQTSLPSRERYPLLGGGGSVLYMLEICLGISNFSSPYSPGRNFSLTHCIGGDSIRFTGMKMDFIMSQKVFYALSLTWGSCSNFALEGRDCWMCIVRWFSHMKFETFLP